MENTGVVSSELVQAVDRIGCLLPMPLLASLWFLLDCAPLEPGLGLLNLSSLSRSQSCQLGWPGAEAGCNDSLLLGQKEN